MGISELSKQMAAIKGNIDVVKRKKQRTRLISDLSHWQTQARRSCMVSGRSERVNLKMKARNFGKSKHCHSLAPAAFVCLLATAPPEVPP